MHIKHDTLEDAGVIRLIEFHLADMQHTAPPESRHALDLSALKQPEITFWSIWDNQNLAGIGALKELDVQHGEIKSMRTASTYLRQGIAARMLAHIIEQAMLRGYQRVSLETGSMDYFRPASQLYFAHGFVECEPFGHYQPDPNSLFLTKHLLAEGGNLMND